MKSPRRHRVLSPVILLVLTSLVSVRWCAAEMLAGVSKVDVTDRKAGPVNDPLYVKALVLQQGDTRMAIVTVDAVAIGEIGYIKNDYLPKVRDEVQKRTGIAPQHVLINASHCHGVVRRDADQLTIQAITQAAENMVPVHVGVGSGNENRIMENRRLLMKDGREIDVRHAYSMPPDAAVAEVGPVDPEIGLIRFDRTDGSPLALIYNFACHPIQGVPGHRNTADITGFASSVIEENLGDQCTALFIQGCGGDINPVFYKDVDHPRHAEPLGNMLGLSTLRAARKIMTAADDRLSVINETLALPRADTSDKIIQLLAHRERLVNSLSGTTLSLKTFIPLLIKHRVSEEFPGYYSHGYLHEKTIGRDDLEQTDKSNQAAIKSYIRNIETMEQLTRLNTNLRLLQKHQAEQLEAGSRTIDVELMGVRIGDCVMTSFPGELTVRIGLNLKSASPHEHTLVAGYTNGYIYYAPTTEQLKNVGGAQEDSDCILAPHWQGIYEKKASEILKRL